MSVDGRVSGGSREVLVLSVGDVLVAAGVAVLLGQAEVDDVHKVALLAETPRVKINLSSSCPRRNGLNNKVKHY